MHDCSSPRPDAWSLWKGATPSGKTGLFNPAATIAYLQLPSSRPGSFTRWDPRSGAGAAYASGRRSRLRPEMISGPQGDLKHTGHVGLDGAFFGDVAFLGDKYGQLPKQVVNPCECRPAPGQLGSHARTCVRDCNSTLKKHGRQRHPHTVEYCIYICMK